MLPTLFTRRLPQVRNDFFSEMYKTFDDLFDKDLFDLTQYEDFTTLYGDYPKVDVTSYEDRVEIVAGLSGMNKEDVSVEVKQKVIYIKGEKKQKKEEKGKAIVRELKHSSFIRSFALNNSLDENSIDAKLENGILTIVIKKLEKSVEPEVKKIAIK